MRIVAWTVGIYGRPGGHTHTNNFFVCFCIFVFFHFCRSIFVFLYFCIFNVIRRVYITSCVHAQDSSLSSPRAKRAGPKGLRAESARAFTGRRNSHSGRGEDFLTGQPDFFTETAVTPERKVQKWFPKWEINRHAEG